MLTEHCRISQLPRRLDADRLIVQRIVIQFPDLQQIFRLRNSKWQQRKLQSSAVASESSASLLLFDRTRQNTSDSISKLLCGGKSRIDEYVGAIDSFEVKSLSSVNQPVRAIRSSASFEDLISLRVNQSATGTNKLPNEHINIIIGGGNDDELLATRNPP